MVVTYDWETVGDESPRVLIHKTSGRIYWNTVVHQYLGFPQSVMLQYDDDNNCIGILMGYDFSVLQDDEGNFYIEAADALSECGLVFPLDEHISYEPSKPENSHNRIIVEL